MNQKYTVSLTEEERKTIHKLLNENMLSICFKEVDTWAGIKD